MWVMNGSAPGAIQHSQHLAAVRLRDIKLRVPLRELLQYLLLLDLLLRRHSLGLHPLLPEHLLDLGLHARLQLGQPRLRRHAFLRVDRRVRVDHALPPGILLELAERDVQGVAVLDAPARLARLHALEQGPVDDGVVPEADLQGVGARVHERLRRVRAVRNLDEQLHLVDGLGPHRRVSSDDAPSVFRVGIEQVLADVEQEGYCFCCCCCCCCCF
mmetsp:Transcript_7689/g.18767  ORF Transcript_7689/g.18767 Transcript_7689/m.18767 type:complete len:215 (+) Transcript_7689:170-814(+)